MKYFQTRATKKAIKDRIIRDISNLFGVEKEKKNKLKTK